MIPHTLLELTILVAIVAVGAVLLAVLLALGAVGTAAAARALAANHRPAWLAVPPLGCDLCCSWWGVALGELSLAATAWALVPGLELWTLVTAAGAVHAPAVGLAWLALTRHTLAEQRLAAAQRRDGDTASVL